MPVCRLRYTGHGLTRCMQLYGLDQSPSLCAEDLSLGRHQKAGVVRHPWQGEQPEHVQALGPPEAEPHDLTGGSLAPAERAAEYAGAAWHQLL